MFKRIKNLILPKNHKALLRAIEIELRLKSYVAGCSEIPGKYSRVIARSSEQAARIARNYLRMHGDIYIFTAEMWDEHVVENDGKVVEPFLFPCENV